jgi:enoyl-CoA hydratase/carnithine racemase
MNEATAHIVTERLQGVLRVEIRRPEKRNALTAAMYGRLADVFQDAAGDKDIRVLLLHGQPDVFTAGNDLGEFLNDPPMNEDAPVFRFLAAFRVFPKPFMAAVTGAAVGIGTTMLLHCDLVYAGEGARFQLPFVGLGLCPEAASSLLLPALVGHARAAEIILLGEPFGAQKAQEIGLVNAVLPDAGLLEHALTQAHKLAAQPPAAVRLSKQLLKRSQAALVAGTMAEEDRQFKTRLVSPEAKEAFGAFLDKRKPDFSRFS